MHSIYGLFRKHKLLLKNRNGNQDILHNRRKITADTSIRLAKYFGVSDRYFLNLQNDLDVRELKQELVIELAAIPVLMQA